MEKTSIIIFAKNPDSGNVKTRLANSLGKEKAIQVYKELLIYTENVVKFLNFPIFIYWDILPKRPEYFQSNIDNFRIQKGQNLGEKMENAFREVMIKSSSAIIIGSDCPCINENHIKTALISLTEYDYCIGPAQDGGYYLLGLKKFSKIWFQNIQWSTETVFDETQTIAQKAGLKGYILPTLYDIDQESDYLQWLSDIPI